jgi:hypothetical protein
MRQCQGVGAGGEALANIYSSRVKKSFSAMYLLITPVCSSACQTIRSSLFSYTQSTLRPPEVHVRTIHFNVNAQFAWGLRELIICMPCMHVGAKIVHVYVQLYVLV